MCQFGSVVFDNGKNKIGADEGSTEFFCPFRLRSMTSPMPDNVRLLIWNLLLLQMSFGWLFCLFVYFYFSVLSGLVFEMLSSVFLGIV